MANNRENITPSDISDDESAFDLFMNSIRAGVVRDAFQGKTRFKAVVLTAPLPISVAAAMTVGENAAGGRFKFRARIIDSPSPHSIYPDPCDPEIATNVTEVLKRIKLHTEFYSSESFSLVKPKKGSIVVVELKPNVFSYDLSEGEYVGLVDASTATAQGLTTSVCSPKSAFGSGEFGFLGGDGSILPAGLWAPFFDSRGYFKKEFHPPKLLALPDMLQLYFVLQGRPDVKVKDNGGVRSIPKVVNNTNPIRSSTSLHMLGLAKDVAISIDGKSGIGTPMAKEYWLDDEIQKILWSFQSHYNVRWGGNFNMGNAEPSYAKGGRIVPGVTGPAKYDGRIFCAEGQHYQLNVDDTYTNMHPDVIAALKASNVKSVRNSTQRKELYIGIARDFGIIA